MTFLPTIYPSSIARAISAIDEVPAFKELPDGFLRIVVRIIKKIVLRNPTKAILASRATLAEESGKSIETVHRCMRWLENKGFIARDQKARSGLRGSSSPVSPTQALLDALLLSANSKTEIDRAKNSARALPTSQQKDFVRIEGLVIPKELSWLSLEGQLPATAILKLMAMAKQKQQRLSDVVEATKSYLQPLRHKVLFCYLRKLINKGQDFKQRVTEVQEAHAQAQQDDRIERKRIELVGRSFTTADKQRIITVEDSGIIKVQRGSDIAYGNITVQFLDAISEGRLTPYFGQ